MNHEYRESPAAADYCGACGQPYALCRGAKPFDLAFLKEHPEGAPDAGEWDRWCARYGVDPNTPDERLLDDFLHGRKPRMTAQRMITQAMNAIKSELPLTPEQEAYCLRRINELQSSWDNPFSMGQVADFQVNLRWRDDAQQAWYAACDAFSEAYRRMPHTTRRLQDRAEVVELERLWRLS